MQPNFYVSCRPKLKQLLKLGLLPVTYWLEILDLVLYFRILKGDTFPDNNGLVQIKLNNKLVLPVIITLSQVFSQRHLVLKQYHFRTVSLSAQVEYGTLGLNITPGEKDLSQSAATFKCSLTRKYNGLLRDVYDQDNAVTFKSNCVKCHVNRNLAHLLQKPYCF